MYAILLLLTSQLAREFLRGMKQRNSGRKQGLRLYVFYYFIFDFIYLSERRPMNSKIIFDNIYDQLTFNQDPLEPYHFQQLQPSFQKNKSSHQRKNMREFYERQIIHNSVAWMNSEQIKEKYAKSFIKISQSKMEGRKDLREMSAEYQKNRGSLQEKKGIIPEYLKVSEKAKRALEVMSKGQKRDGVQPIKERKDPKKGLVYKNRIKPIFAAPDKILQIQSLQTVQLERKQINLMGKEESKVQSEKKVIHNLEPLRKSKQEFFTKNIQQLQQSRKNKISLQRQHRYGYAKPFQPPKNISAYAYIIYEPDYSLNQRQQYLEEKIEREESPKKKFMHSHKVIVSQNSKCMVEVASLTKIMTCILALQLCSEYSINAEEEEIFIGKFQSSIGGTSAQISDGQIYKLEDLFYGLMLPSGNDASIAIAVWGGKVLMDEVMGGRKKKIYYKKFITEMNKKAKVLGMEKTNYANSHGLVNFSNKSCAYDVALLSEYAMKNKKFRKIVRTKNYTTSVTYYKRSHSPSKIQHSVLNEEKFQEQNNEDDRDLNSEEESEGKKEGLERTQRNITWSNTHQLLHERPSEYIGIKTGVTTVAGPCLSSCVRSRENRTFIIVVLGCEKLGMRFVDTQSLKKWAYKWIGLKSPKKKRKIQEQNNNEMNQ